MKKLHMLPTEDVLLQCLANDTIERNIDVLRFCSILDSLHECTSIAIDGAWGSGKTFFVKLTKMIIDSYCNPSMLSPLVKESVEGAKAANISIYENFSVNQTHSTVYYDAWENDDDSDPVLSIINALIKTKQVSYRIQNQRQAIDILKALADCLTGRSIAALCDAIQGKDIMADINNSKSINDFMSEFLDYAVGKENNRLVVFIDELDRCKPSFAVLLLERIKHFFTDNRFTFVFSLNQDQLQHTIKSYYGNGMNASKYLEKLFDISIPLPEANIQRFVAHLGIREKTYYYDKVFFAVIRYFGLELRDMSKLLQYLKLTTYDLAHDKGKYNRTSFDDARNFGLIYITPILIGLRLHDISKYKSFIDGEFEDPFIDILVLPDIRTRHSSYMTSSKEILVDTDTQALVDVPGDKIVVDIRIRLSNLYHAIFRKPQDDYIEITIGNIHIDKHLKPDLLKLINPLSEHANIEP